MGFMIVPLVFATGFGIDYGRAQQTQTKLNAIADLRPGGGVAQHHGQHR
jgi:hypothetical protein